ncbi:hypothetical protein TNCV_4254981, partial [Trichonephila clavipes]
RHLKKSDPNFLYDLLVLFFQSQFHDLNESEGSPIRELDLLSFVDLADWLATSTAACKSSEYLNSASYPIFGTKIPQPETWNLHISYKETAATDYNGSYAEVDDLYMGFHSVRWLPPKGIPVYRALKSTDGKERGLQSCQKVERRYHGATARSSWKSEMARMITKKKSEFDINLVILWFGNAYLLDRCGQTASQRAVSYLMENPWIKPKLLGTDTAAESFL